MIILAAMLSSAPVLPSLDRGWLNNWAQIEAAVSSSRDDVRPRKVPVRGQSAAAGRPLQLSALTNINGM